MKYLVSTLTLFAFSLNALAQSFTYDNANRLTQISYGNGLIITYNYDKLGNRISQSISASPLPLLLNSFNVSATLCDVTIGWESGDQSGIRLFVIERSNDGRNFIPVAEIIPVNQRSYLYKDQGSGKRYLYYRLRLHKLDGSYSYSQTASVFTDCGNDLFSVYPNPAQERVKIRFQATLSGVYQFELWDVQGRHVTSKDVKAEAEINTVSFSFTGIAPGTYYLKLITPSGTTLGIEKLQKI